MHARRPGHDIAKNMDGSDSLAEENYIWTFIQYGYTVGQLEGKIAIYILLFVVFLIPRPEVSKFKPLYSSDSSLLKADSYLKILGYNYV